MNHLDKSSITVSLVMVSPKGVGTAWGHSASGACIEFSHDTATMIQLFHRLRESGRETESDPLVVDAAKYSGVHEIPQTECPVHTLPDIAPGTAVAFAPY